LKLAFPPFHGWFLKVLFLVDEDGWLLGFSKLIAVVWLFLLSVSLVLFLLLSLFQVSFSLWEVYSPKGVFFLSSCLNLYWGLALSLLDVFLGFSWVLVYSLLVFLFLSMPSVV
jgi:hypothetical protein